MTVSKELAPQAETQTREILPSKQKFYAGGMVMLPELSLRYLLGLCVREKMINIKRALKKFRPTK